MSDKGAITCTHPDQDSCQARNVNTCSGATCEKRSMHSAWSNAVHKQYLHRVDTFETARYQFNNGHTAAGEQGTGSIGAYGVDTRGTRDIMDAWMHAADLSSFSYIAHTRSKNSTSVSTGASWTRTGVRTRGAGVGRFGRVAMVRCEQSHTSNPERSNAVKTGTRRSA